MHYFLILCLCVLATAKITVQGAYAKKNINSLKDAVLFNGMVFLFSALIFIKDALSINPSIFLFSLVFGVLTVLFQMCYIQAMSCGNVSLTVLIVNLSMIIPVSVSFFCYGEDMTGLRCLGIVLTVLSLFLNTDKKSDRHTLPVWLRLSVLASLCNGALAVCQKVFSQTTWKDSAATFVSGSYIVATVLSFLLYFALGCKNNAEKINFKFNAIIYAVCVGVILGVFQMLNTKAMAVINGTLFFPMYYGGALILSYVSSVIIFKERLKRNQIISFCIGVFAIILMNL